MRARVLVISPTQSSRPVFAIVISEKGGAERREVFDRAEISVGRVQGNDLMLPKGNVSKRHARLIYRDARFIVTDLNSTNGTYVNRRRISQATIVREGDRIYIGDFVLRIELPEGASEPSTGGDQTGSGPVPAQVRPAAVSESGATAYPEREPEEPSGTQYPEVPGPPRMPSPSAPRQEALSDSQPSEKLPLASVVDVSHADIDLRQLAASGDEPSQRGHRTALGLLVSRVVSGLRPGELDSEISDEVRAHVERAIEERSQELHAQGEIPADTDLARLAQEAQAELLELGPLGPLLVDPTVSEIVATRYDTVTAVRGGRHVAVEPAFSSEESLRRTVAKLCRVAGSARESADGACERRLRDGSRLWAVTGTSAPSGLLVIQKPRRVGATLEELVRSGTISRAIATFLGQCVAARLNVLVSGPRDPGTAAIVGALAAAATDSRLVVLHELDDVSPVHDWITRLTLADDPVESARLVRVAARVPGARLVAELGSSHVAAAFIDAVGDGAQGVIAAAHAQSARRALARLAADVAAHRPGTSASAARDAVAATFDVVVEVGRLRDTRLRVLRVAELAGVTGEEIRVNDVFTFSVERTAAGGAVEGTFAAAGQVPRVAEEMGARGFVLEGSLFTRPPSR
jgi:pilus assembly protein CpaF